jgi:hypothetical protein
MTASVFLSADRVHKLQDHVLGRTTHSEAATLYAVRYTTCPDNADAGGTIDTNFAAVAVTNDTTFWSNSASQAKVNAGTILWAPYSGGSSSHAGWGLYDHATSRGATHLVAVVRFASAETVAASSTPFVGAGDFSLTLKNTGARIFPGNYLIAKILDLEFGRTSFTAAATLTMKSYTVQPVAAGTGGTESTYTGYVALTLNNDTVTWAAAASLTKKNAIGLPLPLSTTSETTAGFAFWDGSNLYLVCTPAASLAVVSGKGPVVPAQTLNWIWSAA